MISETRVPVKAPNSPLFLQALRRELNQIGVASNHPGYVVGQAADTVGDKAARFQDQDIKFRVQPPGATGRRHAGRVSPDYHDLLGHPPKY